MNTPLVTVAINNYNYGRFLQRAIDSALKQTYPHVEVVVVDDGSTDNSRDVIASYGEAIVPVLKSNGGQDSALNAGFAHSQGEIVCLLDSDDIFVAHKIAAIVKTFEQNPDIGWCFHALKITNDVTGADIGKTRAFAGDRQDYSTRCDFRNDMRWARLPYYPAPTSGLCFKKSLTERFVPIRETFLKTHADCYLRCAAMAISSGFLLANILAIQYIHGNNSETLGTRPVLNEREIITACLLRANFPQVSLYANRLFMRGYSSYLEFKAELEPDYQAFIDGYWSMCSPLDKSLIRAAMLYRNRPWRKRLQFIQLAAPKSQQRT